MLCILIKLLLLLWKKWNRNLSVKIPQYDKTKFIITDIFPFSFRKEYFFSTSFLERTRRNKFLIIITSFIFEFSIIFCSFTHLGNKQRVMDNYPRRTAGAMPPSCTVIKGSIQQTSSISGFYIHQSSCSSGSKMALCSANSFSLP